MRKYFKPSSFILYILSTLVCFFFGAFAAVLSGAAENQGLASGAIVVFWALLCGLAGLILSIIAISYWSIKRIKIANWILLGLLLVCYAITYYRYVERKKEKYNKMSSIQSEAKLSQTAIIHHLGYY